MTIDQERNYISQHPKYKDSPRWRARVMRMPDPQVHAIYKQFQKVDYKKLEREMKKQEKRKRTVSPDEYFRVYGGNKMMVENVWKFFLEKAPIVDIQRFCEENGYCLVIFDSQNYCLEKEYGR